MLIKIMSSIMSYVRRNLRKKELCTAALDLETSNIVRPTALNLSADIYIVLKFVSAS